MNTSALRHLTCPAFAVVLFLAAGAHGDTPETTIGDAADAVRFAQVAPRMKEFVDKGEVAGAVTLVVTPEKVVHHGAVGMADVAAGKGMDGDTMFWIASMTKPITGTAILMLQDEGKLSVDDPVAKYVPELGELKTTDGKPANLTLRHLMTHTSGMSEATSEESKAAKTLADLIPAYAKKPVQFPPGSKWQYCQSGINTLGRIVEVASGQPFADFLDKRLFAPLGMKDTTFYPSAAQLPRIAKAYKFVDGKPEEAKIFILEGKDPTARDRYPAANGGLFSTAGDYGRFCRMILNNGTLDGKTYLKPESVKLMTTVQTGDDIKTGFTEGNGWGLTWCVVRKSQGATAALSPGTHGHGGAYGTQAWIDPEKKVAYILMVQRSNFPNADASDVRKVFQETAATALAK